MNARTLVLTTCLGYALAACSGPSGHGITKARNATAHRPKPVATRPLEDVRESSVPLMPRAVTSFGAAVLGDAVYTLGGYSGRPHAYSREGQSGELWRLSLRDGTWTQLPGSQPAQATPLVVLNDLLVRAGGMRALNAIDEPEQVMSLSEAGYFDPVAKEWKPLPAMPQPRSSHALAAIGNELFVLGGWTLTGEREEGRFLDQALVFDRTSQTWTPFEQPFRTRALAAAVLDGVVVVLGGIDDQRKTSRAVHIYDPKHHTWSRGPDFPSDGFGIAATSDGNTLYASARDGVLYALDAPNGQFRPLQRLFFARFFHQLVMADAEHVLALGGIAGMHVGARIRPVESVDVSKPTPTIMQFTLTNPLRGRNRQGMFVVLDSLYAFGGNRSLKQHDFAPQDFVADAGRLDLAGLFWERLPPFPTPRQTVQTAVLGQRVLAVGGFGHDQADARKEHDEARAQADAFAFDLEQGQWSEAPNRLDRPRTQFGLTEHAGALWIFGGLDFDPARGAAQFEHPRSILRAEPDGPFVATGLSLPHARRAFGGAQLDGKYYLVGGMAEEFAPVKACEVFDFTTQTFGEIPCPAPRISPQLVALNGKLYLAGGSTPTDHGLVENPSLEVYDPVTRSWSTLLASLPLPPHNLSMLPFQGNLLLYSAHNEEGVVKLALIRVP